MFDAICISDVHLGSVNCRSKELCAFLEEIESGILETKVLIINGDLFDSLEFQRLKKRHWKVLSHLRKLSDTIEIIWIRGNHDEYAQEVVSHLIGAKTFTRHVLKSGGKRILILHGDIYDDFISKYPLITHIADRIYKLFQYIDPWCVFSKLIKRNNNAKIIENKSIKLAERLNCNAVCCGHTHHAVKNVIHNGIQYFNSGCWVEMPATYLVIDNGKIELKHYLKD
jgi:UDP-2,3-diacylglucosamine pyrophosphatase LpxH